MTPSSWANTPISAPADWANHPVVAAERAARRMAMPVFAATVTTVIAFFGLTLVGGRFGELIRDIPFTVIAVLIASLVECFLILPNHMAHAIAHSAKEHWYDLPNRVVNSGFSLGARSPVPPLIAWVVWARYVVVAMMVVILASQIALFIRGRRELAVLQRAGTRLGHRQFHHGRRCDAG